MLDILYRVVAKLLTKIFDKPLALPSYMELELVNKLKNRFQDLLHLQDEDMPASQAVWASNMNRLRELILNNNPRFFLRWDVVRSSMFVTHPRYIQKELNFLKRQPDWNTRWREAIKESPQGHPLPYPFYPSSSGNLIHHAYHLAQFEQGMHMPVQDMECVLEFGGGYGSMCRLFHRLGFKGTYIILDLPPFSALQEYYLMSIGFVVRDIHEIRSANAGITCISDLEKLKPFFQSIKRRHNGMFISTWSLSETSIHVRASVLPLINMFDYFLIAYQHRFAEVDNVRFFTEVKKRFDYHVAWHSWEIEHLPGNSYLIGKRLPYIVMQ